MVKLSTLFNFAVAAKNDAPGDIDVKSVVYKYMADKPLDVGIFGKINESFLSNFVFEAPLVGTFDLQITKYVGLMWISAVLMMLVFIPLARKIKKAPMGSKSRWVNFWEAIIGFVHDEIVAPNFDQKYVKKAMPYFLTVFFFIFFANYFGQVPYSKSITGNAAVTAGLASFTLVGMFAVGMVKQGPLWVVKGIVPGGIPILLFPLLWIIEFVGLLIKPFALTIRLFANMSGGHVVVVIFLSLIIIFQSYAVAVGSVAISLLIYIIKLLVCFLQAFIFAILSAMFIGASMHAH